jgi:hypothetical protein
MQPGPSDTDGYGSCRCCTSLLYKTAGVSCGLEYTAPDLGALGGTRTPNLLIRRQCHAHPLPAHSRAGLLDCYSLMRSRWQR